MATAGELVYEMSALDNQVAFGKATGGAVGYLEDEVGLAPFDRENQGGNLEGAYVLIYKGTGSGQFRTIETWNRSDHRLEVTPNFTDAPDTTSEYVVLNDHPQGYLDALRQASRRLRGLKPRPYAVSLDRQAEIPGNLVKNGLFRLYSGSAMPDWTLTGAGNDDGAYADAPDSITGWALKFTDVVSLSQTLRLGPTYKAGDRLYVYVLAHVADENASLYAKLGTEDNVELPFGWNWTKVERVLTETDLEDGLSLRIDVATAAIDGMVAAAWAPRSVTTYTPHVLHLPEDAAIDSFHGPLEVSRMFSTDDTPHRLPPRGEVPIESFRLTRSPNLTLELPFGLDLGRCLVRWNGLKLLDELNDYDDEWDGEGVTGLRLLAEAYYLSRRARTPEDRGVARRMVNDAVDEARNLSPWNGGDTVFVIE